MFYLLYQDNNPKSEWKPFLEILPREYSSILSLPDDEMDLLIHSEMLTEIINVQNLLLIQYRYFMKRYGNKDPNFKTLFGNVTLERFVWAYEAVWTRQNSIPHTGEKKIENLSRTGAIIPFWDMSNHKHGKPVTDYNVEKKALIFYSMENVKEGQEVFNFYGDRSNVQLYLTNGFTDLSTPFIGPIRLIFKVPNHDQNFSLRKELCEKLEIKPNQAMWLPLKTDVMPEKSVLNAMKRIVVLKSKFFSSEIGIL